MDAIEAAIKKAQADTARPSLIMVRTHIGQGSPKVDDCSAHGEPLGPECTLTTKENYAWPKDAFHIPADALARFREAVDRGQGQEAQWDKLFAAYAAKYPAEADQLAGQLKGELPAGWEEALPAFKPQDGPLATRAASGKVLNALAPALPNMVGGSADLAPSNKTMISNSGDMRGQGADCGRNIHFGVREHAMGAIVNGMALHGGVIPYSGTFFVFSDFMRPALRLAALMDVHSLFIFTHDSIGVGEDGPTHQPVEHLMALRVMPGFSLIRPADANETAAAWRAALVRKRPAALVLSRQKLPILDPGQYPVAQGAAKGAYVLADCEGTPQIIIMATGAEVHLALAAREELAKDGVACRVVSMPSWDIFAEQDKAYRDEVLPPKVEARLAVEAGATLGWERYVGDAGKIIGLDRFGASAPGGVVFKKLGFSVENVVAKARELLG